jgi:uncharacterized protein
MAAFQVMAKPIGPICNLSCKYCYYLEKSSLYGNQQTFRMGEDLLESYISQYIQSQTSSTIIFLWQGGEPTLLGIPFYERVVKLQAKYSNGKRIENSFQTNGTLLNDQWGEFLAKNGFLVGISIDGPEEIHNSFRVDKSNHPTFYGVLRGINILKRHGVEFNTLTVVNRENSYKPLEVYRFLKEIGSKYIQFIPIVEEYVSEPDTNGLHFLKPYSHRSMEVSEWSVEPLQYGRFLRTIFDEWVRMDVARTFVNIFDVALESWMGMEQSLCVFARKCGTALVIEHNGDLYSCDHFVYPDNKLGNILKQSLLTLATLPQQKHFGEAKALGLPKCCTECDVCFACNGECPKHRFLQTDSGEPGLNYLCVGYKYFFHYIDAYMCFMANELKHNRPPANVMAWSGGEPTTPF